MARRDMNYMMDYEDNGFGEDIFAQNEALANIINPPAAPTPAPVEVDYYAQQFADDFAPTPVEVDYYAQQFAPDVFAPVYTPPAAIETPAPVYTPPVVETPAVVDTPVAPTGIATLAPETLPEAPTGVAALAPATTVKPSDQEIVKFLTDNPSLGDVEIARIMDSTGLRPEDIARATNSKVEDVTARYEAVTSTAPAAPAAPTTTPASAVTPPADTTAAADKIKQQILGQGITSKWSGEGFGSAEANAADMAKIMAGIGITDIKQFGKVPILEQAVVKQGYNGQPAQQDEDGNYFIVQPSGEYDSEGNQISTRVNVDPSKLEKTYGFYENVIGSEDSATTFVAVDPSKVITKDGVPMVQTGTTFGNKETGQAVPNTYSERQQGNFFGGTFAGKGNTGYGVQFDAQGNPIFYTQGASSNDLANIMKDLGPIGQIGLAIATGGLSIPQQIAANMAIQVLSGKDIGDAIKSAAISFAGSQIPGMDFMSDGASFIKDLGLSEAVTNTLTKSFQNAAVSAGTALLSGQDVGQAMLRGAATGGVNGAVNSLLGNIEGFGNLTGAQKAMVTNAVTGVISGKPLDQIVINTAINAANSAIAEAKNASTEDTLTKAGLTNTDTTSSTKDALTSPDTTATTSKLATKDITSSITGTDKIDTIDTDITKILQNAGLTQDTEFGDLQGAIDRNAAAGPGTTSFKDAYAAARLAYGPDRTFEWNGKKYTTESATEAEKKADAKIASLNQSNLSTITDAAKTVAAQNDTAARNAALAETAARIAALKTSNTDAGGSYVNDVQYDANGNVTGGSMNLSERGKIAEYAGALALDSTSQIASFVTGTLKAVNVLERGGTVDNAVNSYADFAKAKTPAEMQAASADFSKNMAAAKDGWDALAVVGKTIVSNPGFVAYNVASEILQEGAQLVASGGVLTAAKLVGAAPKIARALGIATEVVLDMMESGGGAAEDAYKRAKAAGMSDAEAQAASQKALAIGAVTTGTLNLVPGGNALTKQIFGDSAGKLGAKEIATTAAKVGFKEAGVEAVEAGVIEGGTQKIIDPDKDLNWTQIAGTSAWEAVIGGKTTATISAVDSTISSLQDSGLSETEIKSVADTAADTIKSSTSPSNASDALITQLQNAGLTEQQSITASNEIIGDQILGSKQTLDNLGVTKLDGDQVVATDSDGNKVTLSELLGESATGKSSGEVKVNPSTVIGTNEEGKSVTIAELTAITTSKANIEAQANITAQAKADAQTKAAADAQAKAEAQIKTAEAAQAKATADIAEAKTQAEAKAAATAKAAADAQAKAAAEAKAAADANAKATAEAQAKTEAQTKAAAEAQAKADANAKAAADAKAASEAQAKASADAQAKAEAQTKAAADAKAASEAQAKASADAQAKAEAQAKASADAQAKAEAQTKASADAQAKADANAKAAADAKAASEAQTKASAEAQAKAEAQIKAAADAQAKADANAKAAADAQAKAEAQTKAAADAKAKAEADAAAAKTQAEAKAAAAAKAAAEAQAKAAAEAKAIADANAKVTAEAQAKAEAQTKAAAEAQAKAEAQTKAAADAKAKAEADAKAAADAQAKANADAKVAADAQAKADADAKTALAAQVKADEEARKAASAQAKADDDAKTAAAAQAKADDDAKKAADAQAKANAQSKIATRAKAELDAQARAAALAFSPSQPADTFYYGKDFGSKKQKVGKKGKLKQEEYRALSVTKAGAEGEKIEEEALAQKDKTDENDVEELLKNIEGSSDNAMTPEELEEIIRQGA